MRYDLVIRNGAVIDGSGRPRYLADVGVVGGHIAFVGRIRDKGIEEIDAEGQFVAPGFIEVHSHMDAQVFWDSLGTSPAWHGVTTTLIVFVTMVIGGSALRWLAILRGEKSGVSTAKVVQ